MNAPAVVCQPLILSSFIFLQRFLRKSAKSAAIFNMPGWFYKCIYLRATCPNMTASRCIVVTVLRAAEIIKKNFLAIEYSGTTHATITPCHE